MNKLSVPVNSINRRWLNEEKKLKQFNIAFGFTTYNEDYKTMKKLVKYDNNSKYSGPVFVFPAIYGSAKFMEPLIHNLNRLCYCFQYPFELALPSVSEYVDSLLPELQKYICHTERINMVAHSHGVPIAMEMARRIESENYDIRLCLMDNIPYAGVQLLMATLNYPEKHNFGDAFLLEFMRQAKIPNLEQCRQAIYKAKSWPEKLDSFIDTMSEYPPLSKNDIRIIVNGTYNALLTILTADDNTCSKSKLKSKAILMKPVDKVLLFPDDYQVEKYFENPVETLFVEGNHFNMTTKSKTANLINDFFEA